MRLLLWHWGRRGAGPLVALRLAEALGEIQGMPPILSLAAGAEVLRGGGGAWCDWPEPTYRNAGGYVLQWLAAPVLRRRTARRILRLAPLDFAVCAMPAMLDGRMVWALRRQRVPYAVIVHDAHPHPGDRLRFRLLGQKKLLAGAEILFPLSSHVEAGLRRQGFGRNRQRIVKLWLPPFSFGDTPPPFRHGGKPRLLCFGRLLPYKGLDLLADALALLGPELPFEIRICGEGPVSGALARLRAIEGVRVDRRWIPEDELPGLIAWADAVVLPYREASQSGVAAAAIGQGRLVVATNVGGLPEQLERVPGAILCEPEAAALAAALRRVGQASPALTSPALTSPALIPIPTGEWRELAAALVKELENRSDSS